ncbi:DUF3291 domain-containing protein [Rhodobacter calidifons]|uniref:DUF3291 domain-containing protein n=1 Tax=Rhodobacter calidifons TaxID=2715277 RepID=A0ABX0GAY6_9RHOB|nr:DUF3291 domain-containing protein [Rhodobacter calidifons]NHB78012.1 DUF3291 domain-containing protein [Rhodobacter calidifons]
MTPSGMHLAELNVGRLPAPTDAPRVAEFMAALDRVNGLGKRMPGFVWMMEGSGEPGTGNTETKIGGAPQAVSNLTVRESVGTLEQFVMWRLPAGHKPSLDEGQVRLKHREAHGDSLHAFGWKYLKEAQAWKTHGRAQGAAE